MTEDEANEIAVLADEACTALGVQPDDTPLAIATALYEYLGTLREQTVMDDEAEDAALAFGALWGQQVVREVGWQWVFLPDGAAAVASPDGAYAAVPLSDVFALLTDDTQVDSMLLLFNMIVAGSLPPRDSETVVIAGHYDG